MPVIAVGTVEECFYGAIKAINWAERYQGPVVLMSEMSLAERVQNIPRPDLSKVEVNRRLTYQAVSKKNPEYDFKWCPGCGDFGVRRALEFAMINRLEETGLPIVKQRCRRRHLLFLFGNLVPLHRASYGFTRFSSQPRPLAKLINQGMEHPGFAIVHVQSPCTTYNDTFEALKGNPKKGLEPQLWDVPEEHDPSDRAEAHDLLQQGGVPVGVIYQDTTRTTLDDKLSQDLEKARQRPLEEIMDMFKF
ncbi:hypothetical protein GBAR_LOCUS22309 [Geodia barretti]|uniref:Pyruvate ferredoxin oxidoreductase beta subunit C-terminal domain-containing protein n=1 Tax=Geodia barretti TaxID=519541 RepID=A0AA35WZT0_GEOBA|nr:hypothetical protein GBAR_LOCUS22309 [Geodia barretti]